MKLVTVVCLSCLVLFAAVAGASEFQRNEGAAGSANVNAVSRGDAGRAFSLGNQASEFQGDMNTVPAGAIKFAADAPGVGIASSAYMQFPTSAAKQFSAYAEGGSLIGKVMGSLPEDLDVEAKKMPRGTARSMMKFSGGEAGWFGAMDIFNSAAPGPQALANPMKAGSIVDDPSALGLTVVSRN